MKLKTAELIAQASEENGTDVTIYKDYSGRGMMGSKTTALVADSFQHLLMSVAQAAADLRQAENEEDQELTLEDFILDMPRRSDSYGDSRIYY